MFSFVLYSPLKSSAIFTACFARHATQSKDVSMLELLYFIILKRKKPRKLDNSGVDAMLAFLTVILGGDGAAPSLYTSNPVRPVSSDTRHSVYNDLAKFNE